MDKDEALKLALEALAIADNIALVGVAYTPKSIDLELLKIRGARDAIKQALAQPVQEPVAWIQKDMDCDDFDPDSVTCEKPTIAADGWEWVPLCPPCQPPAAQPAQPEQEPVAWISAVTGDVTMQDMSHTVSWVPLTTPPAAPVQPEQEPVGMRWRWPGYAWVYTEKIRSDVAGNPEKELLYTTPPAAQPERKPVALEAVYETIIHWDEGGGKRSRRELARRIAALYTTPPAAQRQWVWLSTADEQEIKSNCTTVACVLKAIKAKLKEKNT
jgi:hypothetical protein